MVPDTLFTLFDTLFLEKRERKEKLSFIPFLVPDTLFFLF